MCEVFPQSIKCPHQSILLKSDITLLILPLGAGQDANLLIYFAVQPTFDHLE